MRAPETGTEEDPTTNRVRGTAAIKAGVSGAIAASFLVAWGGGGLFFTLLGRPSIAFALGAVLCLLASSYARRRPVERLWVKIPLAFAAFWALFALLWELANVFLI